MLNRDLRQPAFRQWREMSPHPCGCHSLYSESSTHMLTQGGVFNPACKIARPSLSGLSYLNYQYTRPLSRGRRSFFYRSVPVAARDRTRALPTDGPARHKSYPTQGTATSWNRIFMRQRAFPYAGDGEARGRQNPSVQVGKDRRILRPSGLWGGRAPESTKIPCRRRRGDEQGPPAGVSPSTRSGAGGSQDRYDERNRRQNARSGTD